MENKDQTRKNYQRLVTAKIKYMFQSLDNDKDQSYVATKNEQ